jgi:hypothetical protein
MALMTGGYPRLGLAVEDAADFTVRGNCMSALRDGETVSVYRQRFYLPGDIVVVRRRDHWNIHRFLGYAWSTHGFAALTQADDANTADPAAKSSRVLGRAGCEVRITDRAVAVARYARAVCKRILEVGR